MKSEDVRQHWENWATRYEGWRQCTMTKTAKMLEIHALARQLEKLPARTVLEAGCGNGLNCIELAKRFPDYRFYGFDYVPEMINAARQIAIDENVASHVEFFVAGLLDLQLDSHFDIVISDRCLINLQSWDLQKQALDILRMKVASNGHLLLIENTVEARQQQTEFRKMFGLPERNQPPFNLFLEAERFVPYLHELGFHVHVDNFSYLHDFLLYVLLPAVNGGKIDYDNPLIQAATEFLLKTDIPANLRSQNPLYICRKT